jgi:hypothetical protein
LAVTHPVEAAVGGVDPASKTNTCQEVPVGLVHPATADTSVIEPIVKAVGLGHVGKVVAVTDVDQLLIPFTAPQSERT